MPAMPIIKVLRPHRLAAAQLTTALIRVDRDREITTHLSPIAPSRDCPATVVACQNHLANFVRIG